MVTLLKMTQPELDEYLQTAIHTLADELMRAHGWSSERSKASSIQFFDALLPHRLVDTPNQFLRTIIANGTKVGVLWFGVRAGNEAVVWDILICPSQRNRGYG